MSHPELVFPLDEAREAEAMLGPDGMFHVEALPAAHEPMTAPRHYKVNPVLAAWAGALHS